MCTESESSYREDSGVNVFNMLRLGKRENISVDHKKYRNVPQSIKRSGMNPATLRLLGGDSGFRQLLLLKEHFLDLEKFMTKSAMRKLVKTMKTAMRKNAVTFFKNLINQE